MLLLLFNALRIYMTPRPKRYNPDLVNKFCDDIRAYVFVCRDVPGSITCMCACDYMCACEYMCVCEYVCL